MKILIMTDMEGCAGILTHDDWVRPTGRYYAQGQRLLTEETNAAIRGLMDGGATEILVVDGHGAGGIDPELLDERAQLLRGAPSPAWPWGLDKSFHGVGFVGQHAKAGTPNSHITHTQWFDHIDMAVNGVSIGEYGQLALCAMELGVPTILACGEEALAREAAALTPGVVTVAVKRGLLPDGLDALDADAYRNAKLSAIHLAPTRVRRLIAEGAKTAARRLAADPHSFRYPQLSPPYTRAVRLRKMGDTPAYAARDTHPDSLIALANMPYTRIL
ncbi:MAG: M55 family metallopeptidase [Lentisphaerae bacterium]|nr:M55 family metallopeptidase [Lentisphaerota bacterium]